MTFMKDRATRIVTNIILTVTSKPKQTTTELREQLLPMLRDEIADIERQIANEIRPQDE